MRKVTKVSFFVAHDEGELYPENEIRKWLFRQEGTLPAGFTITGLDSQEEILPTLPIATPEEQHEEAPRVPSDAGAQVLQARRQRHCKLCGKAGADTRTHPGHGA